MTHDFHTITETPKVRASQEQLSMLYTRYRFAATWCRGKDVLEVACGAGLGLGYLSKVANHVIGGDLDEKNFRIARTCYHTSDNIDVQQFDAHALPFDENSLDVILLYEAIYYLQDPDQFLRECRRVLRSGGVLIICTVNNEWADFNSSPFSTQYFSADALGALLEQNGFYVQLLGAFPVPRQTMKHAVISAIRQFAIRCHLIPKTMRGKEFLKRMFMGKLSQLPHEVFDGMAPYCPPTELTKGSAHAEYKTIYAVGKVA